MVAGVPVTIKYQARRFSYSDASTIAKRAMSDVGDMNVFIDLGSAGETTTAALARLVSLRRNLLHDGRDLCILGLHGQPRDLYNICRLGNLLPRR